MVKKDSFNIVRICSMFRYLDKLITYTILLFTADSASVCYQSSVSNVSERMNCFTVVFLF